MTDNTKYRFFRKLKNKYRLVILNDGTYEERIGIKITPGQNINNINVE